MDRIGIEIHDKYYFNEDDLVDLDCFRNSSKLRQLSTFND